MPERHTRQNRMAGSVRGRHRPVRGGAKQDLPTISAGGCWCGLPHNHDWPDKDKGAPHPREESTVTVESTESPQLTMRMMRKFPNGVARMVTKLCNEHGVKWRFTKDGNHVLLYPPMAIDGDANSTRPFKVGSHRPEAQGIKYLETWVENYVQPWLLKQQAEELARKVNDPTKTVRKPAPRPSPAPVAQEPTPPPPTPPSPAPAPPAPAPDPGGTDPVPFTEGEKMLAAGIEGARKAGRELGQFAAERRKESKGLADNEFATDEAPDGWVGVKDTRGQAANWWKRPGKNEWMCKDCGEIYTQNTGRGGHQRLHSQATKDSLLRIRTKTHLLGIARDMGIDLSDDKVSKRIARLEADLAKVTQQRDDLQARYDLIKEAMKA